jgi:alkyl hydroperoxide reductase subunit F
MYDLVIIGGGPAGVAAGVYAARKRLKTVLVTDFFGGQSLVSSEVQNWIGEINVSGLDLAKKMEGHLRAQEGIEIMEGDLVTSIEEKGDDFSMKTEKGKELEARAVLLVSGSRRKKLGVKGEKELEGKGVFYCSICDAPLMKDKVTAVIGGGNSALEGVIDLLPYAKKIYLLHRRDALRGDAVLQQRAMADPKVEMVYNALTEEIVGTDKVEKIVYKDKESGEKKELEVEGVFVEIGALPNSEFVEGLVEKNEGGEIVVDHKTQRTSREGIWAAGDVCDVAYKQNNISAGDAVKATLNIYDYLNRK